MQKYEYKVVRVGSLEEDREELFNYLGGQGWRFTYIDCEYAFAHFERPIEDSPYYRISGGHNVKGEQDAD